MGAKADIVAHFAASDRLKAVAEANDSFPSSGGVAADNAAARHLSNVGETALYPRPPFTAGALRQSGLIDQWVDFSLTSIAPLVEAGTHVAKLQQPLSVLDQHLSKQTYLVGQSVSLADVIVAVDLIPAFQKSLGPQDREKLANLTRWFDTLRHAPQFKSALGNITFAQSQSKSQQPNGVGKSAKPSAAAKGVPTQQPKKAATKEKKPMAEKTTKPAPKTGGSLEEKANESLGITAKKEGGAVEFADWYKQVIMESNLIEYYDVSGCYILRPGAYSIWEKIMAWFDGEIKKIKVENACFPLFITEDALNKEKDHVEGFAAEVAWVTQSGRSKLDKPIAIRPTSETVMYPYFAKWIRSWRDLPLKLNQWTNVVRWEFSNPTPFIRSREFLWQEGHTAHRKREEAEQEVFHILDLYAKVYTDLLAVPVTKGIKSKAEKFAGSLFSSSVEGFIPATGRGIQGGTSHCLGQNFSKMFGIQFEDQDKTTQMAWQNSWGLSTRSIGVMIMVHGDNKGLVIPPRVAQLQVIVIPIPNSKATAEENKALNDKAASLVKELEDAGIRVDSDTRSIYTPGWKYTHWEVKGVPVSVRIGHKDMARQTVELVRRDTLAKAFVPWSSFQSSVTELLNTIQDDMFAKAKKEYDSCLERATNWADFMAALGRKHMVLAPWCDEEEVERQVKVDSAGLDASGVAQMGAKTLCIPLEQPALLVEDGSELKCFKTGKPAKNWALWGRSY